MNQYLFQPRLAAVIARLAQALGGFMALERAILEVTMRIREETGSEQEAKTIDRRKLRRLVDSAKTNEDVPLTVHELQALDAFLRTRGLSLAQLLSPPGIADALVEQGSVTFMMGSRPDPEQRRIDFSRWDIRAMREILLALNRTGTTVHFGIEDVIFRANSDEHFGVAETVPEKEAWYHCLKDVGPSAVCIGSPKAAHVSEVILAKLFGVQPFAPWPPEKKPPFFFVWPDNDARAEKIKSAFQRNTHQLQTEKTHDPVDPDLLRRFKHEQHKTSAFFDGTTGKLHEVCRSGEQWDSYAVLAAQRRPGNQVWLVAAGLTGPATLGASKMVQWMTPYDMTRDTRSRCSKTVWGVVRVHIEDGTGPEYRRDERRVISHELVGELRYWDPDKQAAIDNPPVVSGWQ